MVYERLDIIEKALMSLEKDVSVLNLEFKAKQFKADMDHTERFIECLAGLEDKMLCEIKKLRDEFECKIEVYLANLNKWKEHFSSLPCNSKKPHKCPICDGCGNSKGVTKIHPNYDFYSQYFRCHSCQGSGILWG